LVAAVVLEVTAGVAVALAVIERHLGFQCFQEILTQLQLEQVVH
jgi:hypothetical protein